jgi:hypothetical protein
MSRDPGEPRRLDDGNQGRAVKAGPLLERHPMPWWVLLHNELTLLGDYSEWWQLVDAKGGVIAKFDDEQDARDVLAIVEEE